MVISDGCVACWNTCPIASGNEVTFTEVKIFQDIDPQYYLDIRDMLGFRSGWT
jgi:hypothetical protein